MSEPFRFPLGRYATNTIFCVEFHGYVEHFVAYFSKRITFENPVLNYQLRDQEDFTVDGTLEISPGTCLCLFGGGRSQEEIESWFQSLEGVGENMPNGFNPVDSSPGSFFMVTNGDIDGILVHNENRLEPILETLEPIFGDSWEKGLNYNVYRGEQLNDFLLTDTNTPCYDPDPVFREALSITSGESP